MWGRFEAYWGVRDLRVAVLRIPAKWEVARAYCERNVFEPRSHAAWSWVEARRFTAGGRNDEAWGGRSRPSATRRARVALEPGWAVARSENQVSNAWPLEASRVERG